MGQDLSGLVLRQQNLMTRIMLLQQSSIIQHIQQQKLQPNQPINQMGDTLLHYAAHKKMFKLIDYLLEQQADPYVKNHRNLTAFDVALPEVREKMLRKYTQVLENIKKEAKIKAQGVAVATKPPSTPKNRQIV